MKVIILAGGFGARFSEDSQFVPKSMIEIGGMPVLWHVMKEFSYYGYNEFVICAGYRQEAVKSWFANYRRHVSDITVDLQNGGGNVILHRKNYEPWVVTVADTGVETKTGGRIKRVQPYIGSETFMMTYGDGVCDVDISKLMEFHRSHGRLATQTVVTLERTEAVLQEEDSTDVGAFREKRRSEGKPFHAGYMVLEPAVFHYIEGDGTEFELGPMERLAAEGQLMNYSHAGYWRCLNTKDDRDVMEKLLARGIAPWKKWTD